MAVTSPAVTSPATTADIEALAKQLQSLREAAAAGEVAQGEPPVATTDVADIQGHKPTLMQRFDSLIGRNPKTAVAAAAAGGFVAGKMLSKNEGPSALPQHILAKLLGACSGGAVSLIAIHAALAHLPDVVPQVASFLAQSPSNVAAGLTCVAGALGLAVGHRVAKGLVEKSDPNAPKVSVSLAEGIRKLTVAYSGPVLGAMVGAALHLAGFSPVGELATAAVGAFGGVLLGPVANQDGIAKPWAWAAVPVGLAAGIYGAMHIQDGFCEFLSVVGGLVATGVTAVAAAAHQNNEFKSK